MKHILIVDDEPHVLRVLRLAMERSGYRVSEASNGRKALEFLEGEHPDVMITDIDMPQMNGKELCLQINADMPDRTFHIFVLTARTEDEHRDWAEKIPIFQFMEKPVSIHRLLIKLADCLANESAAVEPECQTIR